MMTKNTIGWGITVPSAPVSAEVEAELVSEFLPGMGEVIDSVRLPALMTELNEMIRLVGETSTGNIAAVYEFVEQYTVVKAMWLELDLPSPSELMTQLEDQSPVAILVKMSELRNCETPRSCGMVAGELVKSIA